MKSAPVAAVLIAGLIVPQTGCIAPIGANKTSPELTYRQVHDNPVRDGEPSAETKSVLHRFNQSHSFSKSPDAALQLIHQKALEGGERGLLFALAELNYLAGEGLRHNVKPWECRDARDYYLASAIYAWFFLFGEATDPPPGPFDTRFRAACDLYNYGLGWALTERHSTNALPVLESGPRRLSVGRVEIEFVPTAFSKSFGQFDHFLLSDHFLVRGLSVRNGQSGLGAPLAAVTKTIEKVRLSRSVPATVLLRPKGALRDLTQGHFQATLELYPTYDEATVNVDGHSVPLETDTTMPMAYALNQSSVWSLGRAQFFSSEERVPSDIYLMQPYRPGRVPVVLVHGTFSSPVWWAEMFNTLVADPELRKKCQFWVFIYNSGNPFVYSAVRLREALTAKLKELDPAGEDPALQQTVVIGHSQGGLLTKLTATDTGDRLLQTMLRTDRLDLLGLSSEQEALLRRYTCFEALPFVKRAVFISTPHRGSYLASDPVRKLARKFVSLPSKLLEESRQFAGLTEKLNIPNELKGTPTSLDSMSSHNPFLLGLAETPLAPGVKGHSIIAVQGEEDFHKGKDGLVAYDSAHVDYVESEFIVRSFHSCQEKPEVIEEVRRILHQHLATAVPTESSRIN